MVKSEELEEKFIKGCKSVGGKVNKTFYSTKCNSVLRDSKLILFKQEKPWAHLHTPNGDVVIGVKDISSEPQFRIKSEKGLLEVGQESMEVNGEEIGVGKKFEVISGEVKL